MVLPDEVRQALECGHLAHLVTINEDGSPQVTLNWIGLDGDEIIYAAEGDTLKRRYKVLRIGPTSVLMEDTESKRQQTVQLAEEVQS